MYVQVSDIETGVPVGVEISSPSMTCYTDINPSVRVIYLDDVTFQPLDMDTYHLDLNADKGHLHAESRGVVMRDGLGGVRRDVMSVTINPPICAVVC